MPFWFFKYSNWNTHIVSRLDEGFEIVQGSKGRVHVLEVGDVIAEILHWTFVDWREPDCLDAKLRKVGKTGFNSWNAIKQPILFLDFCVENWNHNLFSRQKYINAGYSQMALYYGRSWIFVTILLKFIFSSVFQKKSTVYNEGPPLNPITSFINILSGFLLSLSTIANK